MHKRDVNLRCKKALQGRPFLEIKSRDEEFNYKNTRSHIACYNFVDMHLETITSHISFVCWKSFNGSSNKDTGVVHNVPYELAVDLTDSWTFS